MTEAEQSPNKRPALDAGGRALFDIFGPLARRQ